MSECSTMDVVLKRLLKYRHGLGLSQADFSKCIGSSQTGYSDVERGVNIMTYHVLNGLYQYDFDMDYLFTGKHIVPEDHLLEDLLKNCDALKCRRLYTMMAVGFLELCREDEHKHLWIRCLFSELRVANFLLLQKGNLNARLHYIRLFYGLSQKEMGNVMGVGRTKCGECERKIKHIDADMLLRLYNGGYALPSFFFEEFAGVSAMAALLEQDEKKKKRFYSYLENVLCNIVEDEKMLYTIKNSRVL